MKKITILAGLTLIVSLGLAAACSSGTNTTTTTNTTSANKSAANTSTANTATVTNSAEPKAADETPASVKAAFPDAQNFTKQHKDIPTDAIADIEKDSGAKVPDTDHHSYLAFSTTGGARKQIGAATVVTAGGKEMVVVYDSKNGSPGRRYEKDGGDDRQGFRHSISRYDDSASCGRNYDVERSPAKGGTSGSQDAGKQHHQGAGIRNQTTVGLESEVV